MTLRILRCLLLLSQRHPRFQWVPSNRSPNCKVRASGRTLILVQFNDGFLPADKYVFSMILPGTEGVDSNGDSFYSPYTLNSPRHRVLKISFLTS